MSHSLLPFAVSSQLPDVCRVQGYPRPPNWFALCFLLVFVYLLLFVIHFPRLTGSFSSLGPVQPQLPRPVPVAPFRPISSSAVDLSYLILTTFMLTVSVPITFLITISLMIMPQLSLPLLAYISFCSFAQTPERYLSSRVLRSQISVAPDAQFSCMYRIRFSFRFAYSSLSSVQNFPRCTFC